MISWLSCQAFPAIVQTPRLFKISLDSTNGRLDAAYSHVFDFPLIITLQFAALERKNADANRTHLVGSVPGPAGQFDGLRIPRFGNGR